ncbi:MAG: iron-only hydrogenase system regulator [Clostridia bacterium]
MKRIGVVGIVVLDRECVASVQSLLSNFANLIIGRMGVPDRQNGVSIISLIIEGSTEEISAFTGKLGKLENVKIKSAITTVEV